MPTIRVNIPSRNQTIEFDEGTPESVIQEVIKRDFPRNGSDVAYEVNDDPTFSKSISNEDFELYEGFLDKKKTDWVSAAASGAGYLMSTVGTGIKGLFEARNLNPQVAAATAIESGAQGTRDLYGLLAQSEDPSSVFFKFKDWINGTGTVEDRKKQWLEARDFSENTRKMEAGQQTFTGIDPALVNNDVKNALKYAADPMLFFPGIGELLGAGKLGARVTGAAMEAAGRTAQAVTRPLVNIVDASTRMAGEAFGTNVNAIKGLAAGSGVTGVVMGVPGVREAAMAIGTIEGVNKAGQVLESAGQALGRTPTRIGALESLALNPNASAVDRALAKVGRYGGDDLIDLGARSAAGAVEGAVIGTTLGYLSAGEEGAASGLGAGTLLGGAGAGAARLYGKASGAAAIENRHGDYKRFYETLDPETQAKFDTIVKQSGLDGASQVMDIAGLVRGKFNDADVRFSTGEEFAKNHGIDARGIYFPEGDRPIIDINVDKFSSQLTAGHELFHAFKAIDQLRPMAEKVESMIVGNYIIDGNGQSVKTSPGILSEADVLKRFDEYLSKFNDKDGNTTLPENDKFIKANTLLEKTKLVGEELGAEYMNRMIAGSNTDSMLRGFDGLTRTLLDNALISDTEGFLRRTAQSIGLGSKPIESLIFAKLENASPALNATLRDMVRARRNMSERVEMIEGSGSLISRKDLSNPIAAKMAMDMGIAETSPDGVVRMRSNDVLAKEDMVSADALSVAIKSAPVVDVSEPRMREVDGKIVGDGISNAQLAAIQSSPGIIDKLKKGISIVKDAMENGYVIFIRNGKATKEIKSRLTGKKLKRYEDGFRITERDVVPFALNTSKAGNLYIATFDISKARNEAIKLAGRGNLGPYGSDFQTFYGDLTRYLNNLSDRVNAVPTKELLGDATKAAYLTDFFGGKDGTSGRYIRNFTLDRMIDMRLTGEKVNMSQLAYDRNARQFMPAETIGDGKVFNSPDSGFRIISKDAGKHSLYAPTGERVGIYDTQAKAEAISNKLINQSTRISVSDPKIVDGIVTAPESGAFKFTKDIAANFMPADSKVKLDDYADRIIIALAADRMGVGPAEVGPLSNRKTLSVPTQGGREFMKIFNGGGWAFTNIKTSDTFLSRLRQFADRNGNTIVGVTILNEINHLNNRVGQLAYVETLQAAIEGGVVSKSQADAHIKEISRRIGASKAGPKSLPQSTRDLFSNINDLDSLVNAVINREVNFNSAAWLVKKAQAKTLPISYNESTAMGMSVEQIARGLTDKELLDIPSYSVVALMEVNVNQKPDLNNFHHAYPVTVHGKTIGFLDKFYNLADLSTEPKIRNESGAVTAQPVQNVMPVMDNIRNTIETKKGIPSDPTQRGEVNFMPADSAAPEAKFYSSRIISAVENSSQGKANGSQWKATIKNSKLGVNQDEYALTRVEDLEAGKTYTKAEVLDYLRANEVVVKDVTLGDEGRNLGHFDLARIDDLEQKQQTRGLRNDEKEELAKLQKRQDTVVEGPTHFSQYTLPGAKEGSYREVLLTVPEKNTRQEKLDAITEKSNRLLAGRSVAQLSENERTSYSVFERDFNKIADNTEKSGGWRDGHDQYSDIPNPIVRLRTNERTTADGKRMLFLEEIQAPQKGQFEKMPALFQKNWRDIAFKWSLRTAADNGFDSVGWTTGEQQAARYDLSKQIDKLYWYPSEDGKGTLIASSKEQGDIINKQIAANEIGDYVGKEIAKRLLDAKPMETMNAAEANQVAEQMAMGGMGDETVAPHRLSGVDLKIGGEGLKKLYDQDFRNVVNNLPVVKKSGQKVEMVEIVTQDQKMVESPINVGEPTFERSQLTTPVHAINVTPEMRNASVSFMPAMQFSAAENLLKQADLRATLPELKRNVGVVFDTPQEIADVIADWTKSAKRLRDEVIEKNTKNANESTDLEAKRSNEALKWDAIVAKAETDLAGALRDANMSVPPRFRRRGALPEEIREYMTNQLRARKEKVGSKIMFRNAIEDSGDFARPIDRMAWMAKVYESKAEAGQRILQYVKQYGSGLIHESITSGSTYFYLPNGTKYRVSDHPKNGISSIALPPALSDKWPMVSFQPSMRFSAPESLPNGKVWRGENDYAIIQKEGGKFRVHSPIGLIGIAASYEAAEKMANKRNNK